MSSDIVNKLGDNLKQSSIQLQNFIQPVQKCETAAGLNPTPSTIVRLRDDQQSTNYKSGSRITFHFPKEGNIKTDTLKLMFTLKPIGFLTNVSAGCGPTYDISTVFRRLSVRIGEVEVDTIENYGSLSRLLSLAFDDPTQMFNGRAILEGKQPWQIQTYSINDLNRYIYHWRDGQASNVGNFGVPRRYMVDIHSGFFSQSKIIPLENLNEKLNLELFVEEFGKVFMASNFTGRFLAGCTLEITTPELIYERVNFDEIMRQEFNQMLASSKYVLQYISWSYNRFSLQNQVRQWFRIPIRSKYLKFAFAVIKSDTDLAVNSYDPQATYASLNPDTVSNVNMAKRTAVRQYYFSIGTHRFPQQQIQVIQTRLVDGTTPTSGADTPYSGNVVEPWYHLERIGALLGKKLYGGTVGTEILWSPFETYDNTGFVAPVYGSSSKTRVPFFLLMSTAFQEVLPTGTIQTYAPGAASNEHLTFHIEFNNASYDASNNPVALPSPYVEVYTCYDNYLSINEGGSAVLEC